MTASPLPYTTNPPPHVTTPPSHTTGRPLGQLSGTQPSIRTWKPYLVVLCYEATISARQEHRDAFVQSLFHAVHESVLIVDDMAQVDQHLITLPYRELSNERWIAQRMVLFNGEAHELESVFHRRFPKLPTTNFCRLRDLRIVHLD